MCRCTLFHEYNFYRYIVKNICVKSLHTLHLSSDLQQFWREFSFCCFQYNSRKHYSTSPCCFVGRLDWISSQAIKSIIYVDIYSSLQFLLRNHFSYTFPSILPGSLFYGYFRILIFLFAFILSLLFTLGKNQLFFFQIFSCWPIHFLVLPFKLFLKFSFLKPIFFLALILPIFVTIVSHVQLFEFSNLHSLHLINLVSLLNWHLSNNMYICEIKKNINIYTII